MRDGDAPPRERAAIYARVSTDRQESLNQITELRSFCGTRGWGVVAEYTDEDVSGKVERKPKLEAMLRDAHRRAFDVVAFWSFDRLTRCGPEDAADILARIEATGCDFVSLREPSLNTLGPWRRIVVDMLAIVAHMEAQRVSDRTKAGLARARAQGRKLGRPRATYTITAADVAALRARGLSWAEASKAAGVPPTSLRRLAKNVDAGSGGGHGD